MLEERPAWGDASAFLRCARENMRERGEGAVAMLIGSFLFAGCNVLAKWIYGHGASQTALFCVRGLIVYFMNAALEGARSGKASARRVLLLQVGSRRIAFLAVLRSTAGFVGISFLNMSFQVIHLADAFALTLSVNTLLTVALARYCLGGSERLSGRALGGGAIGIAGILFVTQPGGLFGGHPPDPAGVALALASGCSLSLFSVLSRVLSRASATESLSGSMLLSYYMVVIGGYSALIALLVAAAGPTANAPAWATFTLPAAASVWLWVILYCLGILSGQLLLARGYAKLPAGFASILGLTELSFSWTLDVFVLREPTNALACVGTLTIFIGCAIAATGANKPAGGARIATSEIAVVGAEANSSRRRSGSNIRLSLAGRRAGRGEGSRWLPPPWTRRASLASSDGSQAVDEADWVKARLSEPVREELESIPPEHSRGSKSPPPSPPPPPPTSRELLYVGSRSSRSSTIRSSSRSSWTARRLAASLALVAAWLPAGQPAALLPPPPAAHAVGTQGSPKAPSYRLLDSGDGRRLEHFENRCVSRPCPSATWRPGLSAARWAEADLSYLEKDGPVAASVAREGVWEGDGAAALSAVGSEAAVDSHKEDERTCDAIWSLDSGLGFRLALQLGPSAQVGAFPEQQVHWEWLRSTCADVLAARARANCAAPAGQAATAAAPLRVLNLFAHTGGSTLACAVAGTWAAQAAGASGDTEATSPTIDLVHLDGARSAVGRARTNAELSGLGAVPIRWVCEDALTYVRRAVRRGDRFDGLIVDPPAFGRGGKKGEWRISRDLPVLLDELRQLLSDEPAFVLLTCHDARWSSSALAEALEGLLDGKGARSKVEQGSMVLRAAERPGRDLPMGEYARWKRTL